jgi:hypothetical protein
MSPIFRVVSPCAMTSYRSLARAILDARRFRVPVLCGGTPVSWRAERVGGRVRLSARLAGGAA